MKKIVSFVVLVVSAGYIYADQHDAALVMPELNEQEMALIERKRTELIEGEEELNAVVDAGIAAIAQEAAPEIGIIEYRVRFYKDHEKNTSLWPNLVTKTLMAVSRTQQAAETPLIMLKEVCEALLNEINRGQDHGIMGEVAISMSDGIPSEDCCGGACECLSRYNGNCPCSLDQGTQNRCCGPWMTDNDNVAMSDENDMDTSEEEVAQEPDENGMVEISLDLE